MAPKKRKQSKRQNWLAGVSELTTRIPLDALLGCALLVLVLLAVYYGWQRWGKDALAGANRQLVEEKIHVPEQPEWISRSNVVSEVFRTGSLGELFLFDKDLSLKVHGAFELNPWVAKVNRVGKNPDGSIMVDLDYRQPLAWVEIPPEYTENRQPGVFAIDREAVLLPREDLNGRVTDFPLPRISLRDPSPWPSVAGLAWRDQRILGAVQIVTLLAGDWHALGLKRVQVDSVPGGTSQFIYSLITESRSTIVWGAAPGAEPPNEPVANDKLARLRDEHARRNGFSRSQYLDLRIQTIGAAPQPLR